MDYDIKDLLDAIGPNAALIFAAWIFLSVLQTRYTGAYSRYRELIELYRNGDAQGARRKSLIEQVMLYKRRCERMRRATSIGIASAVLLIAGLIVAGIAVIAGGDNPAFKIVVPILLLGGLACVIWAAIPMFIENREIEQAIRQEPSDLPELAQALDRDTPAHRRTQMEAG
jgi:hypothetical protein